MPWVRGPGTQPHLSREVVPLVTHRVERLGSILTTNSSGQSQPKEANHPIKCKTDFFSPPHLKNLTSPPHPSATFISSSSSPPTPLNSKLWQAFTIQTQISAKLSSRKVWIPLLLEFFWSWGADWTPLIPPWFGLISSVYEGLGLILHVCDDWGWNWMDWFKEIQSSWCC